MLWLEVCGEEMAVFYLRMGFLVLVWAVDTYAELLILCSFVLLAVSYFFSCFCNFDGHDKLCSSVVETRIVGIPLCSFVFTCVTCRRLCVVWLDFPVCLNVALGGARPCVVAARREWGRRVPGVLAVPMPATAAAAPTLTLRRRLAASRPIARPCFLFGR